MKELTMYEGEGIVVEGNNKIIAFYLLFQQNNFDLSRILKLLCVNDHKAELHMISHVD